MKTEAAMVALWVLLASGTTAEERFEDSTGRRLSDEDNSDENVPLDGFISSVYVNLVLFAIAIVLVCVLRRIFPEFYQPRSYVPDDHGAIERKELPGQQHHHHYRREEDYVTGEASTSQLKDAPISRRSSGQRIDKGGPPIIPERTRVSWIWYVWSLPLNTVLNRVGLDAYMFMRFAQRAAQLFVVFTIIGCGILLPLNIKGGTNNEDGFAHLSTANVASRQGILWVHALSVWVFTLATFVLLLELGREYVVLRHRYLRYGVYHRTTSPSRLDVEQRSSSAAESGKSTSAEAPKQDAASGKWNFREPTTDPIKKKLPLSNWSFGAIPPLQQSQIPSTVSAPNQPMLYSVMVEDLPAWISCDWQLYQYFDFLFPGQVQSASLVPYAKKVDGLLDDRNSTLQLLERAEHLRTYSDDSSDTSSEASIEKPLKDNEQPASLPAYGGTSSTSEEKSAEETDSSPASAEKDVHMVLFPPLLQCCTDYACCGPFPRTLCGGMYNKCCRCCDDEGKHERQILDELEDESPDISEDPCCDLGDDRPGAPKKCCYKGRLVKASNYLNKVLSIQSEELNSFRSLAKHQRRRRLSLDVDATETGAETSQKRHAASFNSVKKHMNQGLSYSTEVVSGPQKRALDAKEGFAPSATGFVTFNSLRAVREAALYGKKQFNPILCDRFFELNSDRQKNLRRNTRAVQLEHEAAVVRPAPGPEDIYWPHVAVKEPVRITRRWIMFGATLVLQIFYSALVIAISSLVTVENLEEVIGGLKPLMESNSFIRGFVTGFVPPFVIQYILSYLTPLLQWFSTLEYPPTNSEIALSTSAKLFQFKAWQLMFVFTISGTVLDSLGTIIHHPGDIVNMLGRSLPRLSAFFINLLMLWTLSGMPWEILRIYDLGWFYLYFRKQMLLPVLNYIPLVNKLHKGNGKVARENTYQLWNMTRREFWEQVLQYAGPFSWPSQLTNSLLAFLIGITYASINPVIAPIAALFYISAGFNWKYSFLYVNHKSWETGGTVWPLMARRIIASLIVYQLTLIGLLGLKKSGSSALVVPLLFITILYDRFLQRKVEDLAEVLSPAETEQGDAEETKSSAVSENSFESLEQLSQYQVPEEKRAMSTDCAYVRPSLLPKSDWKPNAIPTKKALYF
eukprot:gb/GECG01002327.1/.p1 GENE.gb/GECG01002327.1/~~gb/GECG01002327.1/.p1  ORF type:complete len:1134 (+),score=97.44 gb/GECG01002327.1/:1-3402(+)